MRSPSRLIPSIKSQSGFEIRRLSINPGLRPGSRSMRMVRLKGGPYVARFVSDGRSWDRCRVRAKMQAHWLEAP